VSDFRVKSGHSLVSFELNKSHSLHFLGGVRKGFPLASVLPPNFIGSWDHFCCGSFLSHQLLIGGASLATCLLDRYKIGTNESNNRPRKERKGTFTKDNEEDPDQRHGIDPQLNPQLS